MWVGSSPAQRARAGPVNVRLTPAGVRRTAVGRGTLDEVRVPDECRSVP